MPKESHVSIGLLSLQSLSLAHTFSRGAWSAASAAETRRHSSLLLMFMVCGLPFSRKNPLRKRVPSLMCLQHQALSGCQRLSYTACNATWLSLKRLSNSSGNKPGLRHGTVPDIHGKATQCFRSGLISKRK